MTEPAIYLRNTQRAIRRIRERASNADFCAGAKMAEDLIQAVIDYETRREAGWSRCLICGAVSREIFTASLAQQPCPHCGASDELQLQAIRQFVSAWNRNKASEIGSPPPSSPPPEPR